MLARLRKSQEENEGGFTLIELLVVMIIIGILAAIAIPVFLNQRKKAQDSAAKADVSTLGKEVATYYVDGIGGTAAGSGAMAVTIDATGRYVLNVTAAAGPPVIAAVANQDLGKASANNLLGAQNFVDSSHWCVSVTNSKGDKAVAGYKYSASGGLGEGVCVAADVA
jgi:prepilin-type N-terminal cleavage/methylation domain-containing protein